MYRNFSIIFSRLIINILISFFYSRLLLNNLGTDDYGLYSVINSFIISIAIVNTILVTSTNRFLAVELGKIKSNIKSVFNNLFTLHLFVSLVIILFGLIFGHIWINNYLNTNENNLNLAKIIFFLSLFVTVTNVISVPFIALQTANNDFKFQSNIIVVQSILLLIIAVVIKYQTDKLLYYSILSSFVYVVINIFQMVYTRKKYKYLKLKIEIDRTNLKEITLYSGWMSIGAFAYMIKNQGNAILINLFFGTSLNASYSISNQVFQQINNVVANLNKIFIPKIMQFEGSNNKVEQQYLGMLSSRYLFYLGLLISLPFLVNVNFILELWLVEVPKYTAVFIQLFLIDMLLLLVSNGISNLIFANGNVKYYQIVVNITNLLNLPLTYILYKLGFEPYYLVITSILFSIISNVFRVYFAKRILGISFKILYKEIFIYLVRIITISVLVFICLTFFNTNGILFVLFSSFIIEIILLVSIFNFGITDNERISIISKIKSYEKFKVLLSKNNKRF